MIVDAHQHFWDPARGDYGWLTPDMPIHRLYGPERLLWGSDWPVLGLAGTYRDWFELARDAGAARQSSAVRAVMGANAVRIYRPSRHIRA